MDSRFLTVKDLTEILGIKTSLAYNIIRKLNAELEAKGYLVQRGRVPKKYFEERYGVAE